MEFTHQVVIDAAVERVWAVYADGEAAGLKARCESAG